MEDEWKFLTAELAHYGVTLDKRTCGLADAWQMLADLATGMVRAHATHAA